MRESRLGGEQIAMALRQAEAGTPVGEVRRRLGVSQAEADAAARGELSRHRLHRVV